MYQVERDFAVEWGDCDPAGIVFYPNYFRWFDAGTHMLMNAAGGGQHVQQEKFGMLGPALVSSSCDFRKTVTFGDRLRHGLHVSEWNARGFTVSHLFMMQGAPSEIVAQGSEKRVCLAREGNGKIHSIPVPASFRDAVERFGAA
jgi:4-hydroxybenzoyl-CoA thioesterase